MIDIRYKSRRTVDVVNERGRGGERRRRRRRRTTRIWAKTRNGVMILPLSKWTHNVI